MMINKKIHIPLIALLTTLLWTACDKIDQPVKNIANQDIPLVINDSVFFSDTTIVDRKQVLVEEFTGHLCVNCAEQSIKLHQLAEDNDFKIVPYSIHAGFNANVVPGGDYAMDFTCPDGNEIFQYFQEPVNPTATIDRVYNNGSQVILPQKWENVINNELAGENLVNMSLTNTWYPNQKSILIETSVNFIQDLPDPYNLVVVIVEDHITAAQKNNEPSVGPTPDWLDYDHRDVLRDVITPVFGNPINNGGVIVSGVEYNDTYFYAPDEVWVISNCKIIAYVMNQSTYEVIQVAELAVKTE